MNWTHEKKLLETVDLVREHGICKAADILKIHRGSVWRRMKTAAEQGIVPRENWAPAVPAGFHLKGVSTHLNEEGKITGQWFKATRDAEDFDLFIESIHDSMNAHDGKCAVIPDPTYVSNSDLLTIYALGDHHLAMFAWAKESGDDYDVNIAWKLLEATMKDLVESSPASAECIVLNLGDFFHADNDKARTDKSGNQLSFDTRYAKVLRMGVDLTILTVQLALQKHGHVIYRALAGNHDPYSSLALAIAVSKFFSNNSRVFVDLDPSYFFVHQFGEVMIAATHGDKKKPTGFISLMAAKWPKIWGTTTYRYGYLGHVHHKSLGGGEENGAIWETFQSLAAKDDWHSGMGFMSHRSMTAITHHRKTGERFRTIRSIDWR